MPKKIFFIFSLFCFFTPLISFAQEETVNIITTYTSPAGVYDQLLTTSFATRTLGVGDTNGDLAYNINDAPSTATAPGQAWIADKMKIGTNFSFPEGFFHASWDSVGSDRVIAIIGSNSTASDAQLHIKQDYNSITSNFDSIELQAQTAGGALRSLVLNPDGGKVGFGTVSTSNPAKLQVDGNVEVSGVVQVRGPAVWTGICGEDEAGTIALNTADRFVGCTGSAWLLLDSP